MNSIAAATASLLLASLPVQEAATPAAACPVPQPPAVERPVKPERPPVPSWVNAYLQKLEAYTRQSVTYAECERAVVLPSPIISG